MYYLYRDGDITVVFTYCMYSSSNLMGRVLRSNSRDYIEDKAYIIHIHDSSEVRHYSTLEQLLEDNFEEFV